MFCVRRIVFYDRAMTLERIYDNPTRPPGVEKVLGAIRSHLNRHAEKAQAVKASAELKPNFESSKPLEALGLTPREAEVLLWIAQGRAYAEIGANIGCAENTVKVHVAHIFEKLRVENRNAAAIRAIEILSAPSNRK